MFKKGAQVEWHLRGFNFAASAANSYFEGTKGSLINLIPTERKLVGSKEPFLPLHFLQLVTVFSLKIVSSSKK